MLSDRRFWIVFAAVLGTAIVLTYLSILLEWPEWSTYISAALAGLAGLATARLTGLGRS